MAPANMQYDMIRVQEEYDTMYDKRGDSKAIFFRQAMISHGKTYKDDTTNIVIFEPDICLIKCHIPLRPLI